MENRNKINVSFGIWEYSDITHESLTHATGIEPTFVRVKGELAPPRYKRMATENSWVLEAPIIKTNEYSTFEEQMDSILRILEPKFGVLKPICEKYNAQFSIGIYIHTDTEESTPSIHLEKRHSKLIGQLNAEWDFDIILMADD